MRRFGQCSFWFFPHPKVFDFSPERIEELMEHLENYERLLIREQDKRPFVPVVSAHINFFIIVASALDQLNLRSPPAGVATSRSPPTTGRRSPPTGRTSRSPPTDASRSPPGAKTIATEPEPEPEPVEDQPDDEA